MAMSPAYSQHMAILVRPAVLSVACRFRLTPAYTEPYSIVMQLDIDTLVTQGLDAALSQLREDVEVACEISHVGGLTDYMLNVAFDAVCPLVDSDRMWAKLSKALRRTYIRSPWQAAARQACREARLALPNYPN